MKSFYLFHYRKYWLYKKCEKIDMQQIKHTYHHIPITITMNIYSILQPSLSFVIFLSYRTFRLSRFLLMLNINRPWHMLSFLLVQNVVTEMAK